MQFIVFLLLLVLSFFSSAKTTQISSGRDVESMVEIMSISKEYNKWVSYVNSNYWYIEKYEPKIYDKILAKIKYDVSGGKSRQEIFSDLNMAVQQLVHKYLVYAPINLLDKYLEQSINLINYFLVRDDSTCIDILTNGEAEKKAINALPKATTDFDFLDEAIVYYYGNRHTAPNKDEVFELSDKIYRNLESVYSNDFLISINDPSDTRVPPLTVCKIYRDLLVEISTLSIKERGTMLRYVISITKNTYSSQFE